jgi:signal transduction histidine kinase
MTMESGMLTDGGGINPVMSRGELRGLFLFESLTDDQLTVLIEEGRRTAWPAGSTVFAEGTPADYFYVLLTGTIRITRRTTTGELEVNRSSYRGAYFGSMVEHMAGLDRPFRGSVYAVTECTLLRLDSRRLAEHMRAWFPMAAHIIAGIVTGARSADQRVDEHDRLAALGRVTAGLTHELNNPAAAAQRAVDELRQRVDGLAESLCALGVAGLTGLQLADLVSTVHALMDTTRSAKPKRLSPIEQSEREDAMGDLLDELSVARAWDRAATLAGAGVRPEQVRQSVAGLPEPARPEAVGLLADLVELHTLLGETSESLSRMTNLLAAAKQYSQLDRAPEQDTDVRDGLDSTLTMLGHKLADVRVVREYPEDLPLVPARPAELNQVWTNLIDNAVAAMDGKGTLTITVTSDATNVTVRLRDTGPGIPDDVQARMFEPFFTTKPVGQGTGLGLDIVRRVIVDRHHGDVGVDSQPGETTFRISLPRDVAPSA